MGTCFAERNTIQQAYNILIATNAAMGNVVWESGLAQGEKNVDILPEGIVVQPRTRYCWRVTMTDNQGETATNHEKANSEGSEDFSPAAGNKTISKPWK